MGTVLSPSLFWLSYLDTKVAEKGIPLSRKTHEAYHTGKLFFQNTLFSGINVSWL